MFSLCRRVLIVLSLVAVFSPLQLNAADPSADAVAPSAPQSNGAEPSVSTDNLMDQGHDTPAPWSATIAEIQADPLLSRQLAQYGEPNMPPTEQINALVLAATTATTKGNALLFADVGSDPLRSNRIARLRQSLVAEGWNTVAVFPPMANQPQPIVSPVQTASAPATPEPGKHADEWLAPDRIMEERLALQTALAAQLSTVRQSLPPGGFTILIAEGMSGPLLAPALEPEATVGIDALIVLGPYLPTDALNQEVADLLVMPKLPLLDLERLNDNRFTLATRDARRIAAAKAFLPHYRQQQLLVSELVAPQSLHDEVVAFLRYLGL